MDGAGVATTTAAADGLIALAFLWVFFCFDTTAVLALFADYLVCFWLWTAGATTTDCFGMGGSFFWCDVAFLSEAESCSMMLIM